MTCPKKDGRRWPSHLLYLVITALDKQKLVPVWADDDDDKATKPGPTSESAIINVNIKILAEVVGRFGANKN